MSGNLGKRLSALFFSLVILVMTSQLCVAAAGAKQTTVSLYMQLGSNMPALVVTEPSAEVYNFETDGTVLMNKWHISKKHYVFIGWFAKGDDGRASKWLGKNGVKVVQGEDNELIAVFNTCPGIKSTNQSVHSYVKVGNGAVKSIAQDLNADEYKLSTDPALIAKQANTKIDFKRYMFDGWYYMDDKMEPYAKVENTTFSLPQGMYLNVVAVFSDTTAPKTVVIEDEKIPLAGPLDISAPSAKVFAEVYAPQRSSTVDMIMLTALICGVCAIVVVSVVKHFRKD